MIIVPFLFNSLQPVAPKTFLFATRSFQTLSAPKGHFKVVFRGTNGRIRIQGDSGRRILLKELTRADNLSKLGEVKLNQAWKGNELLLAIKEDFKTPGNPSSIYPGATDYSPPFIETTLTVPSDTDLDIENSNASINVSGVKGRVRAKTQNGNIVFYPQSRQKNSVSTTTNNGSIQSEVGGDLQQNAIVTLQSYNGNIRVFDSKIPLHLTGGKFYDGTRFVNQDWFVVDGRFTHNKPAGLAKLIDLTGKFIAPPYADSHCHHIDGAYLARQMNDLYLKEGTLYVQSMVNHASLRIESDTVVNQPNSIDVSYANAGITSGWGHPAFLYESLAHPTEPKLTPEERGAYIKAQPRLAIGDAYFLADTEAQLEDIWPRFLSSDPDLLKVFLVNTENRDKNLNGLPGGIGLDPKILPLIVQKAHASGLKVYAHVDTATDMRIAFQSGVDGLAHMPGYGMAADSAEKFLISEPDAKLASGHVVQPTISLAPHYTTDNLPAVRAVQTANIRALVKAGASLVIGSDYFGKTEQDEVRDWKAVGIDDPTTFHSLVETTPQSIFPNRQIGRIAEGYEASFVVLEKDPLVDWSGVFMPARLFKQGVELMIKE